MIGQSIGPYRVLAKLGEGGMGEVYRAHDSRLGREVAVKMLPGGSEFDAERVSRFEREARILAALNHPHIAAIYGVEEASGDGPVKTRSRFLILELVEGGTLADRLRRGPLSLLDALDIARRVADALAAAHDKGIIHRDLKPGNIGLTGNGHPKVLDFGLAKTQLPQSDALTLADHPTASGVVMGTAAYMSPEQARGLPVDKRTDMWSFGCVLFESLTGRSPFAAPTFSDMVAGVLGRDPDWSALPADTPTRVTWLLRRCLEKDLNRRLHDIADARIELDEALTRPADSDSRHVGSGAPPRPRIGTRERIAWGAAACFLATSLGLWVMSRPWAEAPRVGSVPAFRSAVMLPPGLRLASGEDPSARFALSPDGRRLALVASEGAGGFRLFVRPIDGLMPQPLAGTEDASWPFWSPDSQSIAFVSRPDAGGIPGPGAKLKRIDLASGQVTTLGDVQLMAAGAWNRQGVILFTPTGRSPIHRMPASGGPSVPVTRLDEARGEVQHARPFFLPDGRHFLYGVIGDRAAGATAPVGVFVGSLDGPGPPRLVVEGVTNAKFADGHLLFVRGGRLMALPFDVERLQASGEPFQIAEGVAEGGGTGGGTAGAFSPSETGVVAYEAVEPARMQLRWFDRGGTDAGMIGNEGDYGDVVLSPDGTRAAVSLLDPSAAARDIWVIDVSRGQRERLTSGPADDIAPVWSSRGDRIVYSSAERGRIDLYQVPSGGGGRPEPIAVKGLDVGKFAATWSPDERFLMFIGGGRIIRTSDLWILPLDGSGQPSAFAETPSVETQARFSPDGRWVAYVTNDSSQLQVYAQAFPGPGPRHRVSIDGGRYPTWSRDGSEIYFLAPDDWLVAAAIRAEAGGLSIGLIRRLFRLEFRRTRLDAYPYDVSPNGRFLVNTVLEETAPAAISLVVNWPALPSR